MLSLGVIEKSSSPWSSPMGMVIKPGKVRLFLEGAYWQVALDEKSKPITAFTIPGRPLYQLCPLSFAMPHKLCAGLWNKLFPQN